MAWLLTVDKPKTSRAVRTFASQKKFPYQLLKLTVGDNMQLTY